MSTTDTQHNNSNNGVALADTNGSKFDPNSIVPVKLETSESEKVETLGFAIEEAVEKISLLGSGASETCVRDIEENGLDHEIEGKGESESEIESSEADSATSSSFSSSSSGESSSGGSDSDEDGDDDDDEEEEEEKGEEELGQGDANLEVEEGEMEGSDADDDADSDDDDGGGGDKMVGWSMVDDDEIVGGDDDDDGDAVGGGPIRSKNELEDLPPVPPLNATLEPHHQMLPVGVVMSILGAKVIVEGVEKHNPLSEGSILWMTESRKPLGFVDEIFGPVKNPYYVVRYNSENEVPAEIHGGTFVSFVPEFADHVLNNKDLYKKGYDASGANDEELSDEYEFSDDEKEAEYRRMQRMSKRVANDQNPSQRKNNRKKFSPKEHAVPGNPNAPASPSIPNSPTAPVPGHGNHSPFSGIGQGPFVGNTAFPSFQILPSNAGPNIAPNGVWPNATTLPQQPQPSTFPNVFPTNGISWYPQNTQFPYQLPLQGIPFQQQLHPNQGAMLPGVQPNMFAQAMYAQGLVGQNQMTFGLNPPFPQIQPPMGAAPQQGFPSCELQPERNPNLHPNTAPGARSQFHPGASANANNGRKKFHGVGRKGWRPPK